MKVATFFDVVSAMKAGTPLAVTRRTEQFTPLAIEKEDGNGRSWNVRGIYKGGKTDVLYFNEDSETPKFFLP
jgi:hypothetical protein